MGSSGYRAPELMDSGRKRYTNKVDVWSMGCILYEIATGNRAFEDDWEVLQYRYSGKSKNIVFEETFDSHSSETIANHVVEMLQISSSARPSASALSRGFVSHRFQHAGITLYSAVRRGDLETVNIFLDTGVDVNVQPGEAYGNTLQATSERGHEDVVRISLKAEGWIKCYRCEEYIYTGRQCAKCGAQN
jgi:serine/threonine protein kinase